MTRLEAWNELKQICQKHGIPTKGKFGTKANILADIKKIQDEYETSNEDDQFRFGITKEEDCVYAVCENKYTKTGEHTTVKLTELTSMINKSTDIIDMKFNEELLAGSNIKPYFDFDNTYATQEEADEHIKDDKTRAIQAVYAFYQVARFIINNKCEGYEDICYNEQLSRSMGFESNHKLPEKFDCSWVSCLNSSGKKADDKYTNSYHLILNCGIIAKNGAVIKKIIQSNNFIKLSNSIREGKTSIDLDVAIYANESKRRLFRMPFGCKPNSDRKMLPINRETKQPYDPREITPDQLRLFMVSIGDFSEERINKHKAQEIKYEDCDENEIYSLFKKVFPEEAKHHYNARQAGYGIGFTRRSGSLCPLCTDGNRKNERDTQYHGKDSNVFIVNKKGTYIYTCRWSTKSVCLNPDQTIYKKDESMTENKKLTPIEKMNNLIDRMNERKKTFETEKLSQFTENVHNSSEQYVSQIPELIDAIMMKTAPIIAVSANMGEGKTRMVSECLSKLAEQNPDDKMLITSIRIALTKKYVVDFPKFASYLDKEDNKITDNLLICQLDSLNRINWPNTNGKSCRILVLDEADQQLDHLIAETYTGSPKVLDNIEKLKYLIRYAEQIILLSANITPREIAWIKSIRQDSITKTIEINEDGEQVEHVIANNIDKRTKIFINKNPNAQKYTIRLTPKNEEILARIAEDLQNKKKIYLAHNGSTESIETIKRQFSNKFNILAIHSKSINDEDVKKALENPNDEWGKYDLIIASPTVQSGVSYDCKNVFDSVYGIFGSSSNKSGDACQMIRRVRHPINPVINVAIRSIGCRYEPTNKNQLRKSIMNTRMKCFDRAMNLMDYSYNQYGEAELKNSQYLEWYLMIMTDRNFDRSNYTRQFILHQLEYGNTVESIHNLEIEQTDDDKNLRLSVNRENKEAKREIIDEKCEELRDAILITDDEASELKDKRVEITKKESTLLTKYNVYNRYKLNTEIPQACIDYELLLKPKTQKQHKNREMYLGGDITVGLDAINEAEMRREMYERKHLDTEKRTEELIIKSLTHKFNYEKHKIMAEWMKLFGIKSYNRRDIENINKYEKNKFAKIVERISKEYLLTDKCADLNIQQSNAITFKSALAKINAVFKAEFGFSFKKEGDRHKYIYMAKLDNDYLEFDPTLFTSIGLKKELIYTRELTKMNISEHIGCSEVSDIIMNLLF